MNKAVKEKTPVKRKTTVKSKYPAWYKTNTEVQPLNGMMLVKQVNPNISVLELTGGKGKKFTLEDRPSYYLEGSSVDKAEYELGKQILIHEGEVSVSAPLNIKSNSQSFSKISTLYKEMTMKARQEAISSMVKVDIIEYFLIHHGAIQAVID